ncbi:CDP-alcohol phosphatidyltransferase family protein [Paenibacillus sp. MMS18-CY102]|uniref:CDP-alcohol phosphatidyltransferase family protein n=1 Tax=Paenibacillus sp. MMS18-CY102 TaxID=2682849 RepID=UPI001365F6F2|nr:CDP-alcohol phosphatidyltransferase family protein [Paenibacillus sp. MMS18-CY102]MWC27215.1 CDP-diacylglycerol--glycerol-3-phosphate 3-phosphatidyltransferase [Paenibacillus sp. MMS18-CY102]
MNLPNLLTISRFMLIPVYIVVFAGGERMLPAFAVIVAAGITDVLDGYIARKRGQITAIGAMLDPLADKLMLLTVILSLLATGHIPIAAAILMFIRDIGMIAGSAVFHFSGRKTVPANWMGKLTTVLYYAAILFIFIEASFAQVYLWGVVVFSCVTSIMYMIQIFAINRDQVQPIDRSHSHLTGKSGQQREL